MAFFKNVEAHSMHLIFDVRKKKTKLPRLGGRGVKVIREMPESKRFFFDWCLPDIQKAYKIARTLRKSDIIQTCDKTA